MTPQESQDLIDYMYWARDRMLDAVDTISTEQFTRSMGNSFGSIRDTLVHMMWAEMIWLSRWLGETTSPKVSPEKYPDLTSVRVRWRQLELKLRAYFESVDAAKLSAPIGYKGLNGLPYETPLCQMLHHVANHSSYHRGQVTTMLRQLGAAAPKATDLIFFYRERG